MKKIGLIIQQEFLKRVRKKSFLLLTILVPLIFPAIIGGITFLGVRETETAKPENIQVRNEGKIALENSSHFIFTETEGDVSDLKNDFLKSDDFGLLVIPSFDPDNPQGFVLYTKQNQPPEKISQLEGLLKSKIHDLQLVRAKIDKATMDRLNPPVNIQQVSLTEQGEKESNALLSMVFGGILGILIYMFIMAYGTQIMLGVIEEKTSRVAEIIVSSVKPFELMMGKIIGIALVGILQFGIWMVLISALSAAAINYFGAGEAAKQGIEMTQKVKEVPQNEAAKVVEQIQQLPALKMGLLFIFYFLGGYLFYASLFAAVGSAVDSVQETQQFQLPITMPLLLAYIGLYSFILRNPHGDISFWLSVIPLTSPVAMVGRLPFDVPLWELWLSMTLLVFGFIFTVWIAGRIYRIGILTSGAKVNYRILLKWLLMKE